MNTGLAHVIHQAVTNPQFRAHLLDQHKKMVVDHKLQLSQEDAQVLQDVLVYIGNHPADGQLPDTQTEPLPGWDAGGLLPTVTP